MYTGTWLYNHRPANGFANNWDVTLPISYGRYQHPAFVTMIFNSRYQHLTKSDVVVTKILQIIYRPFYSDIVSVCPLVPHLSYTLVHQLPMRTIKPSLTIIARAFSQYKHSYRSLPSPSWIMVTNWDLGNEFPFRHRVHAQYSVTWIPYLFPNFNGCTVEVREWISNFIPYFLMNVITYPSRD